MVMDWDYELCDFISIKALEKKSESIEDLKNCYQCGNILLKSNFLKDKSSNDKLYPRWKICVIRKQKVYHFENREKSMNI